MFDIDEKEDEILVALTQKAGRDCDKAKDTIGFTIMKVHTFVYINNDCPH